MNNAGGRVVQGNGTQSENQRRRLLALAYAGLAGSALFWAGNAVVARGVAGVIPPVTLAFWRWIVALCVVLPFSVGHVIRERREIARQWRRLLALAIFSIATYNTLLYIAAETTTAVNIALVAAAMPVLITLLAWLALGHRPRVRQSMGITTSLAGMLIIIARGRWQTIANLNFNPGDLIMIVAVTCWAAYSVLLRKFTVMLHPLAFLTALIVFGLAVLLPLYAWEALTGPAFRFHVRYLPAIGYVGVFPSVFAYTFWNNGVAVAGPSRAAMFLYLMPVFTAALALIFLGEHLHLFHAAGGVLILFGLYLATVQRKADTSPS